MSAFHEGELALQRRAGVEATAARVARNIAESIPPAVGPFLAAQPFVFGDAPTLADVKQVR